MTGEDRQRYDCDELYGCYSEGYTVGYRCEPCLVPRAIRDAALPSVIQGCFTPDRAESSYLTWAGDLRLSAILESAPGKFHPNQLCASLVRGLHLRHRFSKGSYMAVVRRADFTGSLPTPP